MRGREFARAAPPAVGEPLPVGSEQHDQSPETGGRAAGSENASAKGAPDEDGGESASAGT